MFHQSPNYTADEHNHVIECFHLNMTYKQICESLARRGTTRTLGSVRKHCQVSGLFRRRPMSAEHRQSISRSRAGQYSKASATPARLVSREDASIRRRIVASNAAFEKRLLCERPRTEPSQEPGTSRSWIPVTNPPGVVLTASALTNLV